MAKNEVENYGPILKKYNLQPTHIEDHGKIKKIITSNGVFALKTIAKKVNLQFPGFLQQLFQQGFTRAVPIYPTIDGTYLVYYDQNYHYLMPWVQNHGPTDRVARNHAIFKEIARVHLSTSRKQTIEEDEITSHFERIINQWEEQNQYLESFVEQAEKKWYMSPFELQFCTYFYEVSLASRFARNQLDRWYDKVQETKTFRTALTHGNLSDSHFLFDDKGKGYLSNFEKSAYASPINDLVSLYYRLLKTYPTLCENCVDWYETYRNHNPLRDEEIYLFLSYLSYPEPIYRCVRNYEKNRNKSEREHVQNLQRAYWLTKNIEYVSVKILEAEEKRKQEELNTEEEESHT